jgi:hypothetical protein
MAERMWPRFWECMKQAHEIQIATIQDFELTHPLRGVGCEVKPIVRSGTEFQVRNYFLLQASAPFHMWFGADRSCMVRLLLAPQR